MANPTSAANATSAAPRPSVSRLDRWSPPVSPNVEPLVDAISQTLRYRKAQYAARNATLTATSETAFAVRTRARRGSQNSSACMVPALQSAPTYDDPMTNAASAVTTMAAAVEPSRPSSPSTAWLPYCGSWSQVSSSDSWLCALNDS